MGRGAPSAHGEKAKPAGKPAQEWRLDIGWRDQTGNGALALPMCRIVANAGLKRGGFFSATVANRRNLRARVAEPAILYTRITGP